MRTSKTTTALVGKPKDSIKVGLLARGELPPHVTHEINKVELTVEELLHWEDTKPDVWAQLTDDGLEFEVRGRIPLKKRHAIIGGVVGLMVAGATTLAPYIAPYIHMINFGT